MNEVVQALNRKQVEHLRDAFISVVQSVREGFKDADIRGFKVSFEASGRTFGGEAKVTAIVSANEYGYNAVNSPDLLAAFHEAMRREGFNVTHQALALPAPGVSTEEDEQWA